MTNQSTGTTLGQYELAGKATSLDAVETTAPVEVEEAFDTLESWHHAVILNNDGRQLLVGERADAGSIAYRLYHPPTEADRNGVAGVLVWKRQFDAPSIIAFRPVTDDPDAETVFEPVTALTVIDDGDTDRLSSILNELRTELTGEDWVERGRADTGWDQWNDAVLKLLEFHKEQESSVSYPVTHSFLKGATMHAIARYPGDAEKLLSSAAMRLDRIDDEEHDRSVNSPFALRELLLAYADSHLP